MKEVFLKFKLFLWCGLLVLAVLALTALAPTEPSFAPVLMVRPAAASGPDTAAFSVKNGSVFKNGEQIDSEVCGMPEGIANGIASWAAFGESTLTEAEMGLWFFGEDGKYKAFLPLDFPATCYDVVWSPSGGWFVLMSGPEDGPWGAYATFRLFKADKSGMHLKTELNGVRDHIAWLPDGERFVFARVDGYHDTSEDSSDPYAPKVSAVLYDPSLGEEGQEIVLKEATETQNYYLGGSPWDNPVRRARLDGENIVLSEQYVESPNDWGGAGMEAGKYLERSAEAPIPPAG